jgi:uncharacterized glyoxalase superfamily protein PhnB
MNAQFPQPQVKGGGVAYLCLDGALKAAEFYSHAFAAELAHAHPADEKGRTMHVHLYINGASVMLSDPYPEHGCPFVPPAGFTMMLPVSDVDNWFQRAVEAGCSPAMPPSDMFWGDRYGQVKDPFGVVWGMNGPVMK